MTFFFNICFPRNNCVFTPPNFDRFNLTKLWITLSGLVHEFSRNFVLKEGGTWLRVWSIRFFQCNTNRKENLDALINLLEFLSFCLFAYLCCVCHFPAFGVCFVYWKVFRLRLLFRNINVLFGGSYLVIMKLWWVLLKIAHSSTISLQQE